jgi:hypothetical protein
MKKTFLIIILNSILCYSCNAQNEKSIVENFIKAYNIKDSIKTFKYLHKDFVELFEKDTAIVNKLGYSKNYAWGKVMNDRMEFEIIKVEGNEIETMTTYYSDRDSLLNVSPYKSIRTYFIKDEQIVKVIENKFSDYEKYDNPRREKYNDFFNWLYKEHKLNINDFKFDKNGAEKLKKILIKYSKIK